MRNLFILILHITILGCDSKPTTAQSPQSDHIFIKDSSKYSQKFIADLYESNHPGSIKLIDNYVVVEKDTVSFPNELALNKNYLFEGTKDNRSYILNIKRINESTVSFDFTLSEDNTGIISAKEEADLHPLFFLGAEMDDDDRTGEGYLASEYTKEIEGCVFKIRIGEKDENDRIRAKVDRDCKTELAIELDDSPVLRLVSTE